MTTNNQQDDQPLLDDDDDDTEADDDDDRGEDARLGLTSKVCLSMSALGSDAAVSFAQVFIVPTLQALGTPLTFVSMTPLISSPVCSVVLPLLGYCGDRQSSSTTPTTNTDSNTNTNSPPRTNIERKLRAPTTLNTTNTDTSNNTDSNTSDTTTGTTSNTTTGTTSNTTTGTTSNTTTNIIPTRTDMKRQLIATREEPNSSSNANNSVVHLPEENSICSEQKEKGQRTDNDASMGLPKLRNVCKSKTTRLPNQHDSEATSEEISEKYHTTKRKVATLVVAFSFSLMGVGLVGVASLIRLGEERALGTTLGDVIDYDVSNLVTSSMTTSLGSGVSSSSGEGYTALAVSSTSSWDGESLSMTTRNSSQTTTNTASQQATSSNDTSLASNASFPVTAGLGLVGFALVEVGMDVCSCTTRALVVACTPRADHHQVIVLNMLLAAVGGCLQAVVTYINLGSLLGFGGSLLVQVTVQVVLIYIVIIASVVTASVTAFVIAGPKHQRKKRHSKRNADLCSKGCDDENSVTRVCYNQGTEETLLSLDAHTSCGTDVKTTVALTSECDVTVEKSGSDLLQRHLHNRSSRTVGDASFSRDLYKTSCDVAGKGNLDVMTSLDDVETVSRATKPTSSSSPGNLRHSYNTFTDGVDQSNTIAEKKKRSANMKGHTINLVLACMVTFFGAGVLGCYNNFVPDYLGKVIYGGDPTAPPGSPARAAYEDGVERGAIGILIMYVSALVINLVHSKLLKRIGIKVDLVLANGLLGVSIVTLVMTQNLWLFYVTAVLVGFQRVAFYTVPTIVANDYIQAKVGEDSRGPLKVSSVMSLVTCMMPISYIMLYPLTGPLMTLTQLDATPLYMGAAFSFSSAIAFMFYNVVPTS